jgi:hypothetical protein
MSRVRSIRRASSSSNELIWSRLSLVLQPENHKMIVPQAFSRNLPLNSALYREFKPCLSCFDWEYSETKWRKTMTRLFEHLGETKKKQDEPSESITLN